MYDEERAPFFNIRKENVLTAESGLEVNKVALINDQTDNVVGLVSPNYELVTNEMVNDLFIESLNDLSIVSTNDHMDATTRKWKRHFVFDDEEVNFEITKGDNVGILLEIFNGYDARTAFGYELMGFRWLCENGLVMGKQSLMKESFAHYVDNPEKLRQSYELKFDAFKRNIDTWKEWTEEYFTIQNFNEFVETRSYLGAKVKVAVADSYPGLLSHQKLSATRYGAFNVLTYLATHETKARNGSNLFSNRYRSMNRMAVDLYEYKKAA